MKYGIPIDILIKKNAWNLQKETKKKKDSYQHEGTATGIILNNFYFWKML